MQLTHSFTVPAGVDTAWNTFMDLREVGECFPGATVTDVSGDSFSGTVKVKLGPIAMVYSGTGHFTERDDAAHHAVIKAEGKDKRGNGTAGATATIQLSAEGSESTKVDVTTDLLVTGRPAQFGRGVMQDVSDKLLGQFVQCIEGKLAGGQAGAAKPASSPSGSTTQPASRGTEAARQSSAPAAKPLGTAAMFGATAGSQSWEALSSRGSGESSAREPASSSRGGVAPARSTSTFTQPDDQDDHLDLAATVLPALVKIHGREIAIGVAGLWLGWKLGRFLPG